MDYDYNLISIGSGSAGRRVAVALKRKGWKVAIIEADVVGHFGGTCIRTGCIPTKALIEKTEQTHQFEDAKNHKKRIVERISKGTLRSVRDRREVDVIEGFAKFVDSHTLSVGDRIISSEIIVIATGSEPAIPPIPGLRECNYVTSTEVLNLEVLPKDLLLIGGGRIGIELGQMLNHLSVNVTIFEGLDQILPGEDKEMASMIEEFLKDEGISIYKNRFVDEVRQKKDESGNDIFEVHLTGGDHAGVYTGDMLFVATGRIARTSKLNLHNTKVQVNRSSIVVDDFFQTHEPNIFAIGDVIGNPMFTNWASFHSGILQANLAISKMRVAEWKSMPDKALPKIAFLTPELASVGLTEEHAREQYGDDVVVYKYQNKWLGKSMIVDDWDGVLKGIGRKGSNEILGVHLWGVRTGSLIQLIIFAIDNKLGWKELSDMVYGHPVLVEGIYSLSSNMKGLTGVS